MRKQRRQQSVALWLALLLGGTGCGGSGSGGPLGAPLPKPIIGTTGNDTLVGTSGDDELRGLSGDDVLRGLGGDDFLEGGPGADTLDGGAGTDEANYEDSPSAVTIDLGAGTASGGEATGDTFIGMEDLTGTLFDDTLTGDAGNNYLIGGFGIDIIEGGGGDDIIEGEEGDDIVSGGDGTDTVDGGGGDDMIFGGPGDDLLVSGRGADFLDGGPGVDRIDYGGGTAVWVDLEAGVGMVGPDGPADGDTIVDVERVSGTNAADKLYGNAADNWFQAHGAHNIVHGRDGADTILCGDDGDDIRGGAGSDLITSGMGPDRLEYDATGQGTDTIDFNPSFDLFVFDAAAYGVAVGTLPAAQFGTVSGAYDGQTVAVGAGAGTPIFVYSTGNARLYYDANGTTAGGHEAVADLPAGTLITRTVITFENLP